MSGFLYILSISAILQGPKGLPAFQWHITAKDPAVLQLDRLGCGLQLGGQSSRRGRTLVPPICQ